MSCLQLYWPNFWFSYYWLQIPEKLTTRNLIKPAANGVNGSTKYDHRSCCCDYRTSCHTATYNWTNGSHTRSDGCPPVVPAAPNVEAKAAPVVPAVADRMPAADWPATAIPVFTATPVDRPAPPTPTLFEVFIDSPIEKWLTWLTSLKQYTARW